MCVAVPGRIVQIVDGPGLPMATVDFGGITKQCCLAYLPEAVVGDYTIIQAGFAITLLDEQAALASLALFEELGLLGREPGTGSLVMNQGAAQEQDTRTACDEASGRKSSQEQDTRTAFGGAGGRPS